MTTALKITLELQGPLEFGNPSTFEIYKPPEEAGIYLWLHQFNDKYLVSYVGESSLSKNPSRNLRVRLQEHIIGTLGGGYRLYDLEVLKNCKSIKDREVYFPDDGGTLNFLADFENLSLIAKANLESYHYYWATFEGAEDSSTRRSVEAALVNEIKNSGEYARMLQTSRVSPKNEKARQVEIRLIWPNDEYVFGLNSPVTFGEL